MDAHRPRSRASVPLLNDEQATSRAALQKNSAAPLRNSACAVECPASRLDIARNTGNP